MSFILAFPRVFQEYATIDAAITAAKVFAKQYGRSAAVYEIKTVRTVTPGDPPPIEFPRRGFA